MASTIKVDTIENIAGSGNVSLGSGHNLVVPGDLTVDTNTLFVDASADKVGIGTTSPTVSLQVAGDIKESVSGANAQISAITDGPSNYATFTTTNGSRSYSMQVRPDQSNAFTIRDETGGANRLLISTSGHVTKPSQPAFSVNRTAGNYTSNSVIVWNSVVYNQGNHYNSSNGRFTAPVAGVYQFNVMGSITGNAASVAIHQLRINGSATNTVWPIATSSNHISYGNSFIVSLNSSDYIEIMSATGSATWYGTGNVHNHFSGFLVG